MPGFGPGDLAYSTGTDYITVDDQGGAVRSIPVGPGRYLAIARLAVLNADAGLNVLLRIPDVVEVDQIVLGETQQEATLMGALEVTQAVEQYLELFVIANPGGTAQLTTRICLIGVDEFFPLM